VVRISVRLQLNYHVSLKSFHSGVIEDTVLLGKYRRVIAHTVIDFTKERFAF
jgi:hypothetical protein